MSTKILYKNKIVVWLTRTNHGVPNVNLSPNDSDFKVYKAVDNPLEFVVRDLDRKPINLIGKTFTFTVSNPYTTETIISKDMEIVDDTRGRIKVILSEDDTELLELGFYRYTVLLVNEDGTRNLLYTDQDQTARGYFELFDGPFLARPDDVEILGSNFTPKTVQITPETIKYFSSAYPGDANSGYVDGVHTAVLYTDEWLGEFTIQASLENEIPTDENDWFEVTTQTFTTPVSGLTTYTFTGNYMWVRFRYYNDINNTGSVEKVLYKN